MAQASRPILSWFTPTALAVVLSALLAAAVFAAFGDALGYTGAILDDGRNLILNPHVGSLSRTDILWAFTPHADYAARYIPLSWFFVDLQLAILGLNPSGLHAATFALHGVNTVFLGWVILRFIRRRGVPLTHATVLAAFAAAALYGLHPLRAELASWSSCIIWQRAVFFLLLWAWARTAQDEHPVLEILCYEASLLFYPVALGLAPGLFLAEGFASGWGRSLRRNGPILAVALLCAAATFALGAGASPPNATGHFPLALRVAQGIAVEGRSIVTLFAPVGLNPYAQPLADLLALSPSAVIGAFLVILVVGVAATPRGRVILPGVILYLFLVAPFTWVTSWQDPEIPDRYFTGAHLALAFGVGLLLARLRSAWVTIPVIGLSLLALPRATAESHHWRDETTLFQNVIATLDRSDPGYNQKFAFMEYHVALDLMDRGDQRNAEWAITECLGHDPDSTLYRDASAAIRSAGRTIGLRVSATVNQHQTIAIQAFQEGNPTKALMHLEEIRRLDPGYFATLKQKPTAP